MKRNPFLNLLSPISLIGLLLMPAQATEIAAERVVSGNRWFEVEMIIFQRQPDAALLESFETSAQPELPNRFFDILKPYYQTDIQPLLRQLELCPAHNNPIAADTFFEDPATQLLQFMPRFHYSQTDSVCIFEPQPALWQQPLFASPQWIDSLPMPERLALRPSGWQQHQAAPYLLAREALQLADIANQLQRQPDLELLLHTGFRQAPVTERRSIPSRWYAGRNFQTDHKQSTATPLMSDPLKPGQISLRQPDLLQRIEQRLQQVQQDGISSLGSTQQADGQLPEQQSETEPLWQLDGFFRLHLDHYLFVNTDFLLREPSAGQGLPNQHRIRFSRRVISGEMHYIDHPRLGIILQIRRFQPPEAAD